MKMEKTRLLFMETTVILLLCSLTAASLVSVTRCDNVESVGSVLNVDFMEMNQPCSCIVKPRFNGDLVFTSNVILYDCNTEVRVQKSSGTSDAFAVRCPREHTSKMYTVDNSTVFEIKTRYLNASTDKTFHQSIQVFQDKSFSSPIAVSCTVDESVVIPPQIEEKPNNTTGDQGLLIGLIICGLLVVTLTTIIIFLVFRNMRNQKRDSKQPKNQEIVVNPPALPNRPNSAYTDLQPPQNGSQTDQPYTRLNSQTGPEETPTVPTNRPGSAYTALNPDQTGGLTEQPYTGLSREPESNESVYHDIYPLSRENDASATLASDQYIAMTGGDITERGVVRNTSEDYMNESDTHI